MEKTRAGQKRISIRKVKKREFALHYGTVSSWDASLFVLAEKRGGQTTRQTLLSLELKGELSAPVKNITGFQLTVFPDKTSSLGNAETPSVGSIIATKPLINAVVSLSEQEFQVLLALASSGRLACVHLSFQDPRYGSASIASCSFSSRPPEEE